MKITKSTLPLIRLLRLGGAHNIVRGIDRIIRGLFPLADQIPCVIEVPYHGRSYAASAHHYVDWHVLTIGSYEHEDLRVFSTLHTHVPHGNILDIGANVGHHAYYFATLGWNVWAFEPNPDLWSIIETKLKTAELTSVTLCKFGLGDTDAQLAFVVPDGGNSGTGHFTTSQDTLGTSLPVRRGDDFVQEIGIPRIDLIKIDVQGFEPAVLRGLRRTLLRDRSIVCVEIGPENRPSMPALENLSMLLPDDYCFLHVNKRNIGPIRVSSLEDTTAEDFTRFDGNLFCCPTEKHRWFRQRKPQQ